MFHIEKELLSVSAMFLGQITTFADELETKEAYKKLNVSFETNQIIN